MSHLPPKSTMRKEICFPCRLGVEGDTLGLGWPCASFVEPHLIPGFLQLRPPVVVNPWPRTSRFLTHTHWNTDENKAFRFQVLWHTLTLEMSQFSLCLYLNPSGAHIYMLNVCILVLYNWIQAINYSPPPALSQPPKSSLSLPSVFLVEVSSVRGGWMRTSQRSAAQSRQTLSTPVVRAERGTR